MVVLALEEAQTPSTTLPPVQERGPYRWYVVGVLFIAYVLSAIDAGVIKLLAEPIKHDLGIGDTQLGLLQGFAFAMTYALAALPIGILIDRRNYRSRVIAAGVVFWSAMTIACGAARNFGQLFLARVGVGVGEAALSPTAYSLIGDYFSPRVRPLANAFYAIGYSIGAALAVIVGGKLLVHFSEAGGAVLPLLGAVKPWQAVFACVGLPGLVVALLILTIREPMRRSEARAKAAGAPSFGDAFRFIRDEWRLYLMLIGTIALVGALAIGASAWYPAFLMRTHGWSIAQVTEIYGFALLGSGVAGTLFGGWLSTVLIGRGRRDANMMIVLATVVIKAAPLLAVPLMPTGEWAVAMIALATLVGQGAQGIMIAAIQEVTPSRLRGQVIALTLLAVNLIGTGGGALAFGFLSEHAFTGTDSLRHALFTGTAVLIPVIVVNILAGMNTYRRALAQMEG